MPFEIGQKVYIFTGRYDGRPIIEGVAIIRKRDPRLVDRYLVEFENSKTPCWRFVAPEEAQTDPHGWLEKMQAEYDNALGVVAKKFIKPLS
jgi:hypothetical protein